MDQPLFGVGLFFGAAPPCGRVGLCRGSLFARPCAKNAKHFCLVCGCAAPLSIPQPRRCAPLRRLCRLLDVYFPIFYAKTWGFGLKSRILAGPTPLPWLTSIIIGPNERGFAPLAEGQNGLGMDKGGPKGQTQPACWRRAEQACEP